MQLPSFTDDPVTPEAPKPKPNPNPNQPGSSGKTFSPLWVLMCFSEYSDFHVSWKEVISDLAQSYCELSVQGNASLPVVENSFQKDIFGSGLIFSLLI